MDNKILEIIQTLDDCKCSFSQLRAFIENINQQIPEWEIRIREYQDSGQLLQEERFQSRQYSICGYDPRSRTVFLRLAHSGSTELLYSAPLEYCIAGLYQPANHSSV